MPSALSNSARSLAPKFTEGIALMSTGRPDNRLARTTRSQAARRGKRPTTRCPPRRLVLQCRKQFLQRPGEAPPCSSGHHETPKAHPGGCHQRKAAKSAASALVRGPIAVCERNRTSHSPLARRAAAPAELEAAYYEPAAPPRRACKVGTATDCRNQENTFAYVPARARVRPWRRRVR